MVEDSASTVPATTIAFTEKDPMVMPDETLAVTSPRLSVTPVGL